MRTKALARFIIERHNIYLRRQRGLPAPWTKDPILRRYRFCNCYRELDRVTVWITENWRTPFKEHPHLWFALVIARLLNHPPTLNEFGFPFTWNSQHFTDVLALRRLRGEKVFGSAYIVSTNGRAMNKALYLANEVLDPLWENRRNLRPAIEDTLSEYHATLTQHNGLGSFLAAQVIADLKYTAPMKLAPDWWTFAAPGPGSKRGLNRVFNRPVKSLWNDTDWRLHLRRLRKRLAPMIARADMSRLHAQDLQNCLCEFDKYERVRLGEGRPKQLFTPTEG